MDKNDPRFAEIKKPLTPASPRKIRINRQNLLVSATWIIVIIFFGWYAHQIALVGLNARADLWDYWRPYRIEDIQNAMVHSDAVLRNAEQIADEDHANLPADSPTIAHPGPGLFDPPLNLQNFLDRWQRLRPVYSQIIRAWVRDYDTPYVDAAESMDYPPLRLLTMTLWTWRVQSEFPGLNRFPTRPRHFYDPSIGRNRLLTDDIAAPVLNLNTACTAIAAVTVLILVWIWVQRGDSANPGQWGDPLLLAPIVALLICTILRPHITWTINLPTDDPPQPIDQRVTSLAWWLFMILRFTSAVALARLLPSPFRAPVCGILAATFLWLNPTIILDSHGWPQWDTWILPFFFLSALLVSIDWWLTAGLLIGVGCMFKGQILFAAPVLIFSPLLAGWPIRCWRIITGTAVGAALAVWPWLVTTSFVAHYILGAIFAAAIIVLLSFFRRPITTHFHEIRQWMLRKVQRKPSTETPPTTRSWLIVTLCSVTILFAIILLLRISGQLTIWPRITLLLLSAGILTLPWFLPRRLIGAWLIFVFATSLWLTAFNLGGRSSWWNVGFAFGTIKHNEMELSNNVLSNLAAILHERYDWQVHSPVGTLHLPFLSNPIDIDLRQFLVGIFFLTVLLCTAAAAIHLRRGDPHFLIALAAPWVIFPAILTQMSARYLMFPAAMTATVAAISLRMSLWHLLLTIMGCITFFLRQWPRQQHEIAPLTYKIIRPTHPDMGWLLVAIAAIFLFSALTPTRRASNRQLFKTRRKTASTAGGVAVLPLAKTTS